MSGTATRILFSGYSYQPAPVAPPQWLFTAVFPAYSHIHTSIQQVEFSLSDHLGASSLKLAANQVQTSANPK